MSAPRAITQTSWLNAWTMQRGCAALGVPVATTEVRRELPLPLADGARDGDWLLFTEERSLRRALAGEWRGRFLPQRFPPDLLDDKWAFARWLAEDPAGPQGLPQWAVHDAARARFPLMLKARHSWDGESKLPRGWICRGAEELAARVHGLHESGGRAEQFFLQQWFGDAPMDLLSVGGFFDAEDETRNLACVTRRLAGYGADPSSSAVLATVPDEQGLVRLAQQVLRRLGFRGPYEMEFVLVPGEVPRVLELNPRFWMQHGVFVAEGNGLLKRYLGLDGMADRQAPAPQRVLWLDGTWLLRRLLRVDIRSLRMLFEWRFHRGYRCFIAPSLGALLAAALWRAWRGGN